MAPELAQIGTALGVLLPVIGGIVWLVRLEGRVNTAAVAQDALKEWLERVEAKLDRVIEGKH